MKYALVIMALVLLLVSGCSQFSPQPSVNSSVKDPALAKISLPPGFKISLFADNLGNPRFMLVRDNIVYVASMNEGIVYALSDADNDSVADKAVIFIDNLDGPSSIDYFDGWFYIGETTEVTKVRSSDGLHADLNSSQSIIQLPGDGEHITRTVRINNNFLFISIGSDCNVCKESSLWRAGIIRCGLDGKNCEVFASGLRNSVGLEFDSLTNIFYATENGRDYLGDDLPPDEINIIEQGNNYGWPYCYGNNLHDSEFDKSDNPCVNDTPAFIELQAHSAPLGLLMYRDSVFPAEYSGTLFVAYHGSWNRQVPTGYKVVNVDPDTRQVSDFATGWLQADGKVLGRPVGIALYKGALLVSDDSTGKIYRIYYQQ